MAISTYKIFLMRKVNGVFTKLIDIKDFPDLGGSPEMLETTTLSNPMQTYIPGIQSLDALEFTANYDLADYTALKELEGVESDYAVWFGGLDLGGGNIMPTGSDGKFYFKGKLSVFASGGGVNEVVNMTITIAPSTSIAMDEDTIITLTTAASTSEDLLGKAASDLQENIVVGTDSISGTLKYVEGYTGFSGATAEQEGNYLALYITADVADTVISVELINGTVGHPVTLDNDGQIVLRITNVSTQSIRIIGRKDDGIAVKNYTLTGLVLTPKE